MAVTHQRLLLLSLFLASALGQDAMAPAATPTVPRLRFEPALCPKLQGAEELAKASCGYLVVPENRSQQNYAVPTLRAAPDRIDGLAAGRPEAIEAIALDRVSRAPPPGPGVPALGYGLTYGVSCRESHPFATPEELAAAGRKAFPNYPASVTREGIGGWAYFNEDCRDVWKVPAAPEAMHQPVVSGLPTLLISGSFDTLTSLAGAKAAAVKVSNATIISIPGVGHAVSPASPCAQTVIVSFLADPAAPDTSCVSELKPPSFTSLRREPLRYAARAPRVEPLDGRRQQNRVARCSMSAHGTKHACSMR